MTNEETHWLYGFTEQILKYNLNLNKSVKEQDATILELRSKLKQTQQDINTVLDEIVSEELTGKQEYDACMSYRHDYGLLEEEDRWKVAFHCREWAKAILRAIHTSKNVKEIKERANHVW